MSDTRRKNIATIDLAKPLQRENCGALLATGDENANRFGATIVRNGAAVDVSGCTVSGSFIRADGVTVPLEGVAEGNTVYVDLSASCYTCEGTFTLALKISGDGVVHTVRMVDGYIRRTETGSFAADEETVFAVEQLKALKLETERVLAETNQALAQFGAPDWSVNDETQPGHVKNRTHWRESEIDVLFEEHTIETVEDDLVECATGPVYDEDTGIGLFDNGDSLSVVWDGNAYTCTVRYGRDIGGIFSDYYVGNASLDGKSTVDTGEPFCIVYIIYADVFLIYANAAGTHTLRIDKVKHSYSKLDINYLPNSNIMNGSGEFSICTKDEASTDRATAYSAIALGKKAMATNLYAVSLGGTASGSSSLAIGSESIASGTAATAIGANSKAVGYGSSAIGYWTIATADGQCAIGRNNIEDTAKKYILITGNGADWTARSNAFTVDMNGAGWFKGRPQFGGTEQDNGAQTVMGNGDAEIILSSPSGALFGITVSDNGTLTVAAK